MVSVGGQALAGAARETCQMKSAAHRGIFFAFMGALLWSLNAPIVKFLHADPLFLCGARSLIAGLVLLPFLRPGRINWSFWTVLYFLSYSGLCIGIILALSSTSSVIAIGMQYTSVFWLFLAGLLCRRRCDRQMLLPVAFILGGILLFMSSGTAGTALTGNLIALTEGVAFAVMSVSSAKCSGDNPVGLTALANLFTAGFVFLFMSPSLADIAAMPAAQWPPLLVLGVVQVAGGYACYNIGLKHLPAEKASIIALWEMVLGPAWVALLFHEYPSVRVCIGLVFVIIGMVIHTLPALSSRPKQAGKC